MARINAKGVELIRTKDGAAIQNPISKRISLDRMDIRNGEGIYTDFVETEAINAGHDTVVFRASTQL